MEQTSAFFGNIPPGAPRVAVLPTQHASVGRHNHAFYELVYIRGGFCLHEADDGMILLTEGDYFLVRPGQYHRYVGRSAVQLYNCLFCEECIPERLKDHPCFAQGPVGRAHLDLNERKAVSRTIETLRQELDARDTAWEVKAVGMLYTLLGEYVRVRERLAAESDRSGYTGYVTQALARIDHSYREPLTLRDLAREAGVSGDYLTRQFKQAAGISPLIYLRRYRIARAMDMLSGGVSVSDAASRVGFRSLSHFSREFKKELGLTPSQYRTQNQSDAK